MPSLNMRPASYPALLLFLLLSPYQCAGAAESGNKVKPGELVVDRQIDRPFALVDLHEAELADDEDGSVRRTRRATADLSDERADGRRREEAVLRRQ